MGWKESIVDPLLTSSHLELLYGLVVFTERGIKPSEILQGICTAKCNKIFILFLPRIINTQVVRARQKKILEDCLTMALTAFNANEPKDVQ